jgi:hypothetical protein
MTQFVHQRICDLRVILRDAVKERSGGKSAKLG